MCISYNTKTLAPLLIALLLLLAACGSGSGSNIPTTNGTPGLATKQLLTFPNVGIADSNSLDPAIITDTNTSLIANMIYSGLVKSDINLNVVPDQATWDISSDNKVYTFHLKPNIAFSNGTPVTAQAYVFTLTRALLPELQSPLASLFEGVIVGANDVLRGKTKTLAGVKATDIHTLQITLTQPTPYFLQLLTNAIYFPLNSSIIDQYGETDWPDHVVGSGIGTGPFMVKEWDHSVKMLLVPNPYYYGARTRITQVNMVFTDDPSTALKAYRAGQYDFVWNLSQADQLSAKALPGFIRTSQLQTDLLFFNTRMPPFDNATMRQVFAYATDKVTLAHTIFDDSVIPAPTIIPPGMPGYQQDYAGIPYDKVKAKALLQSLYPDTTTVPPITFSYSSSLITPLEASTLQKMWQDELGITITLRSVETTAYNDEVNKHLVQFGFTQWNADFPDPYDCLALNLLSSASDNVAEWSNLTFDQIITLADQTSGNVRIALYNQAEQLAIQDVAWLPLDHQMLAAIIPASVHGISLNANGLFFGDWSGVYLSQH